MKIKTKYDFISLVCVLFTTMFMVKIIFEYIAYNKVNHYTINAGHLLFFSVLLTITFKLQDSFFKLPLVLAVFVQYLAVIIPTLVYTFIMGNFIELAPTAYQDVFRSYTEFYIVVCIIYYVLYFIDTAKYNSLVKKIQRDKNNKKID